MLWIKLGMTVVSIGGVLLSLSWFGQTGAMKLHVEAAEYAVRGGPREVHAPLAARLRQIRRPHWCFLFSCLVWVAVATVPWFLGESSSLVFGGAAAIALAVALFALGHMLLSAFLADPEADGEAA